MIILTTPDYPGKEIKEVKGLVCGNTIQCRNVGRDIGSAFKNLVGGEMVAYKEMLDSSRKIAIERMLKDALKPLEPMLLLDSNFLLLL